MYSTVLLSDIRYNQINRLFGYNDTLTLAEVSVSPFNQRKLHDNRK